MKRVTLTLPDDLAKKAQAAADADRRNLSNFITLVLADALGETIPRDYAPRGPRTSSQAAALLLTEKAAQYRAKKERKKKG